jgi:hypothetical protein
MQQVKYDFFHPDADDAAFEFTCGAPQLETSILMGPIRLNMLFILQFGVRYYSFPNSKIVLDRVNLLTYTGAWLSKLQHIYQGFR